MKRRRNEGQKRPRGHEEAQLWIYPYRSGALMLALIMREELGKVRASGDAKVLLLRGQAEVERLMKDAFEESGRELSDALYFQQKAFLEFLRALVMLDAFASLRRSLVERLSKYEKSGMASGMDLYNVYRTLGSVLGITLHESVASYPETLPEMPVVKMRGAALRANPDKLFDVLVVERRGAPKVGVARSIAKRDLNAAEDEVNRRAMRR